MKLFQGTTLIWVAVAGVNSQTFLVVDKQSSDLAASEPVVYDCTLTKSVDRRTPPR